MVSGDCGGWRLILMGGFSFLPKASRRASTFLPVCGDAPSCCTTTCLRPSAPILAEMAGITLVVIILK